jgi:hypothetical protein
VHDPVARLLQLLQLLGILFEALEVVQVVPKCLRSLDANGYLLLEKLEEFLFGGDYPFS